MKSEKEVREIYESYLRCYISTKEHTFLDKLEAVRDILQISPEEEYEIMTRLKRQQEVAICH